MNAHSNCDLRQAARVWLGRAVAEISATNGADRERLLKEHSRIAGAYADRGCFDGTAAFNALLAAAKENAHVQDTSERHVVGIIRTEMRAGALNPPPPVQASVTGVAPPVTTTPAVEPPTSPPGSVAPPTVAQNAKEAGSTPASLSLASVNLEAALTQARAGNAVFPCGADKRPTFVASWPAFSTTDENILRQVFERYSAAVPAIDCGKSNLFVIDADRKPDAPDGVVHFEGLCAANNDTLSGAPRVNTPGGGVHYIFSQPEGEPLGNSPGALGGRGIDARGVGGYILAPGATLPDGRRYTYAEGSARLENGPPPPPPQWLLDVIHAGRPPKPTAGKHHNGNGQVLMPVSAPPHALTPEQLSHAENIIKRSLARIVDALPGTSNDTINREAHTLGGIAAQLPPDDAKKLYDYALKVALERASKGGNDPRETQKTFGSGWQRGLAKPLLLGPQMPAEAMESAEASVATLLAKFNASKGSLEIKQKPRPVGAEAQTGEVRAYNQAQGLKTFASGSSLQPSVELIRGSSLTPEPVSWLWPGWLARGKMHILGGLPGAGKTTLAMVIATTVSKGGTWPDGARAPCGNVIIWSGEDDPADTLAPRLRALDADMNRIFFVSGTIVGNDRLPFDPAKDMKGLEKAIADAGGCAMIIVDPVVNAVAGDSHKNTETRRALQTLVDLAASANAALLGVTHFSKGTSGREPIERITGSIAFGAVARVVMIAAKEIEKVDGLPSRRILVRAKSNIGPDDGGFAYELRQVPMPGDERIIASIAKFGEAIEGTARDMLAAAESEPSKDNGALGEAEDFLKKELADNCSVPTTELKAAATAHAIAWRTVERAKKTLGVEAFQHERKWFWRLTPPSHSSDSPTSNSWRSGGLNFGDG